MKKATLLSLIGLLLLFGCASIETPFQVTITEFSDGAQVAVIQYAGPGNTILDYNMSRYLWAYYYEHAGGLPDNVTVIAVEFDLCGYQHLASYPSNIRVRYPQFGGGNSLLHAGVLNGCVHIADDGGLLDSLLTMDSNPLECCERDYVDKVEMRYPRVHNTTEEVEFVIWDNGRNITGANYTCFGGDITRQVTGDELVERNNTYEVPSVFNFTCPAYGAEGKYVITINRMATFNGVIYTWIDTPGNYTEVVIADGGDMERFLLQMNLSSDSAGQLEISNLSIRYNNRLEYGSGPTSTITGSTPPWASDMSVIDDSVLEAETDIGNNSNVDNCSISGTLIDVTNCTDSVIEWSDLDFGEVEDSTIKYTLANSFDSYDSTIINGNGISYFHANGVDYDNGMLYDGQLELVPRDWGIVAVGTIPVYSLFGCDGAGATWIFTGLEQIELLDINWDMRNGCTIEIYESIIGFSGNSNMTGEQKYILADGTYLVFFDLVSPAILTDAAINMDESSTFVVYNGSVTFNNTLGLTGIPRFYIFDGGQLAFANNIAGVYPTVWIVGGQVVDSAVYFSNIDFSSYGSDFTITNQYILGERFVSFNDTSMPLLNNTNTTVVLYNVGTGMQIYYYENYTNNITEIIENGEICNNTRCTNVMYNGTLRALTFDVQGLSSYAVEANPAPSGNGNGDTKSFSVDVESGYVDEPVYFETSAEKVWIEINGPDSFSIVLQTDENGNADFTPYIAGPYHYSADKTGYSKKSGTFLIDEQMAEEVPEEETVPPAEEIVEEPEEEIEEEVPEEEPEVEEAEETPEEVPEEIEKQEEAPIPESEEPEECANVIGICWYWWTGIIAVLLIIAYFAVKTLIRK